jgi:uncharacterized protein
MVLNMDEATFITKFNHIAALVESTLKNAPGCHDYDHTVRVLHTAMAIAAEEPGANTQIVRLAAILHDIARPEEMTAKGNCCHAAIGASAAAILLKDYDFAEAMITAVCASIRKHRYRDNCHPETIEEKIIYDADKLDSIGAVGIGRAFHFAGRENARLHNTEKEAVDSPAYSREDTAYREYLVKLRHIKEKMLTSTGRRLAEQRHAFMEDFFRQLDTEVFG